MVDEDLDDSPEPVSRSARVMRAVLTALVLVAGLAAIAYVAWPEEPYRALRAPGEPSRAAYRRGGVPIENESLERALRDELPLLTTYALRGASTGDDVHEDLRRVRDEVARHASREVPESIRAPLVDLVAVYLDYVDGHGDASGVDARARRLDQMILAAGLRYRVTTGRAYGYAALQTHRVDHVRATSAGSVSVTSRLDATRSADRRSGAVLGPRDAILPLDRVDWFTHRQLLPLLETPRNASLVNDAHLLSRYGFLVPAIEAAALGVSAELRGHCGERVVEVVRGLVRRREAFATYATHLARRGVRARMPEAYEIDLAPYQRFASLDPRFHALESNEKALAGDALAGTYRCVRDGVLAHLTAGLAARLRLAVSGARPVPPSARELLDPRSLRSDTALGEEAVVEEVHGFVATVAGGPLPKAALTFLVACWTDGSNCAGSEASASRLVLVELMRDLAPELVPSLREVGPAEVLAFATRLYGLPSAELRGLASRVGARLARGANP